MDPFITGIVGVVGLIIVLLAGVPVAFAMGMVGVAGIAVLASPEVALTTLGRVPFGIAGNWMLSSVPMFVFMGFLASLGGLGAVGFAVSQKWLGHYRGGLAMATVAGCAMFGAVCGSSVAAAAAFGTIAVPEMRKHDYDPGFAVGVVAAGGTLANLIPPSVTFIIYGLITLTDISALFIAGILPGVVLALGYMVTAYIQVRRNPSLAKTVPRVRLKERFSGIWKIWAIAILFVVVMGGLYIGVFTATEAGAVGAGGALILLVLTHAFNKRSFGVALADSARTCIMVATILYGASLFGYFLALAGLPQRLSELISNAQMNRYVILLMVAVMYVILGCFMEATSMVVLTLPTVFPVMTALGFDPIWFGVMMTMFIEVGLITPPVGLNVYVLASVVPDVPMAHVFKSIMPYVYADIVIIAILIAFPQISLFLPSHMIRG